jgi:quinol monooxygenase YgiN
MDNQISWHVDLAIKSEQLDNFHTLTGEMVETARRETGVLSYQRFVSEDCKTVHIYERYADSDTAIAHLQTFTKVFAERFEGMVERKRFIVLGCPTAQLRAILDGLGAIYLKPLGEFAYWA